MTPRIMLVDDEPGYRELLGQILRDEGAQSLTTQRIADVAGVNIASLYQYEDSYDGTWMEKYKSPESDYHDSDLYTLSFYWTITTITTVGYGDIGGTNNLERTFCSIMMVIGVFGFSFANGSLSSIIQNYDQTNANYHEKL